jgi:hypothetical protein
MAHSSESSPWCEYALSTATQKWRWRIRLDEPQAPLNATPADWTLLGCSRCPSCPLQAADDAVCPAANAVADVVDALGTVASIDTVDVVVRTAEREVRKTTTGAAAARSVLGLLLATSGCPVLQEMRPLARHHLPFATEEEWMFRLVGLQLLRSWFAARDGVVDNVSLQALPAYLEQLRTLNIAFAARLRKACAKDAPANAMVQLFSLSVGAGCDFDDGLASLRAFLTG